MCNLVAIPLSKGIVGACKVFDKVKDGEAASEIMQMYSRWLPFGMAMILLSSFFFFFSSFAPLYDTTKTLVMSSNSGVPSAVYWSIVLVMIMFMLFAVVGGAFITIMIWILPKAPGGTEGHASSMARTMKNQLIAFELLNWFKWFIAGFVCIGALSQIGL